MKKEIIKTFYFTKEERERLQDIQIGITSHNASLTGMQIYKGAMIEDAYKRLGIDKEAPKGFSKKVQYSLHDGKVTYTESPVKEEIKKEDTK